LSRRRGRAVLDTSAALDWIGGLDPIASRVAQYAYLYLPAVVVGELLLGLELSGRSQQAQEGVQRLLTWCDVLHIDEGTAPHYAVLKAYLRRQGTPIPENDVWVIATARQHSLPLLATDRRHFRFDLFDGIEGVNLVPL
jgi:tRNA(fMet)-specific endonuclease VapC